MRSSKTGARLRDTRFNPVDVAVGKQVRARREAVGLGSDELANMVELDTLEIEAIEIGRRRAGAKELHRLATALHVELTYFFREIEQ